MALLSRLFAPLRETAEGPAVAARRASLPVLVLGFALAYFLAARLGIATSLPPEGIVILWPPNAVVLVVLVSVEMRRWPVFLVATVAAEVAADLPDYPLLAALGYGVVNFFEAALAAALIRRFIGGVPTLATLSDYVRFLLIGPLVASGTAALFGAGIYKLGNPALDYLHYWRVFWLGDALGLLVLGSLLLIWKGRGLRAGSLGARAYGELGLLYAALLGVSYWAFFATSDAPRAYLVFPLLIWAALRFGVLGASGAVLLTVGASIASALAGYGPFVTLSDVNRIVALQGLIAAVSVTTLMLAFASDDSRRVAANLAAEIRKQRGTEAKLRRAAGELERTNAALDETVEARTQALRQSLARNELLLKEVHHRVKNNLQIISSLLATYRRRTADPTSSEGFADAQAQVSAIATAYDLITQMENVDEVDLAEVVPALCQGIGLAAGPQVQLTVEAPRPCPVPAESAVALALAANELVTNAIKHGGAEGVSRITVTCFPEQGRAVLRVADDGPGFPAGFELERDGGFGTQMVLAVLSQAGGRLRLLPAQSGSVVEISLALADGGAARQGENAG